MSHLYEVPSFTAFANGKDASQGVKFVESQFQERILDFLENNELKKPEFTGSKKYPDPSPKAIIITPQAKGKKTVSKYSKLVDRIAEALNKTLDLSEEPKRQGYFVASTVPKNATSSEHGLMDGKMAFVYAPDNSSSAKNCERNLSAALWFGAPEVYTAMFKTQWVEQTGAPESGKGDKKCQKTSSAESVTTKTKTSDSKPTGKVGKPKKTKPKVSYDCKGSSMCSKSLQKYCDEAADSLRSGGIYE